MTRREMKRRAEAAARWIDAGYPDYFAMCKRLKNGHYVTNMRDGDPTSDAVRVTVRWLSDLYDDIKRHDPADLAEVEREMSL